MYDNYDQTAWRTDEQLIDDSLRRVFGEPPKIDQKFAELLEKIEKTSGRQDGEET